MAGRSMIWDSDNWRAVWKFVTVPADGELEIRHRVDGAQSLEAGLVAGESYRAESTDMCLWTRLKKFDGNIDDGLFIVLWRNTATYTTCQAYRAERLIPTKFEGVRFRQWREGGESEGVNDVSNFHGLALVIERRTAEFEIGSTVD